MLQQRDSGGVQPVFVMCDSWEQLHEESTSLEEQKLGRRYPLAVIAGRWGSIEAAEDYLLLRGRTAVTRAMLSVLSRHMKSDRGSPIITTGEMDCSCGFRCFKFSVCFLL